jgi:uncharacterized protein (DUF2141 family)
MTKILSVIIVCVCALGGAVAVATTAEPVGAIVVTVTDLRSDKGRVYLALFKAGEGFPKHPEKAFRKEMARIKKGTAKAFFDDVPYGEYAISIFHDEDNDAKLAYGTFGIPKEGYGFSNNASSMFGPPSFDKAKFALNAAEKAVSIKVKYGWF